MKISKQVQVVFWIFLFSSLIIASDDDSKKLQLKHILPQLGDVGGWFPEDEAQFAAGKDLYLLINGGAEIYNEYGFREVVFQTYSTKDGQSINLEIYEMDSQEAAYGIYTFKTGEEGHPIEVGFEGWFETYYLNFWRGNYLVTAIGLDTDSTTLDGIKRIAGAVDSKLKIESEKPQIISYLPSENLQVNTITYLKGNLALFNQYLFESKDIFGLREGVVGTYTDYTLFIFQYENRDESKKWYRIASDHLKESERFSNFTDLISQFEISNHQSKRLSVRQYEKWIIIIIGNSNTNVKQIINSVEAKLPRSDS